jgi:Rrf2 family transcriptional regulator, cysteine metabolism repressor
MRHALFSAKAEYACIAMLELAARFRDTVPIQLKTIADSHGIPKRFLVQILLQLKSAGLVASIRGAAGGYQLTRAPDQISLADIIRVTDSAEATTQPNRPHDPSGTPFTKAVRSVWQDILIAQQRVLDRTSLAELVQRASADDALMYQI